MNFKNCVLLGALVMSLLQACKKDKQLPQVTMGLTDQQLNVKMGELLTLTAKSADGQVYTQEWKINDDVSDATDTLKFVPVSSGIYKIAYTATNRDGKFEYVYTVNVGAVMVEENSQNDRYVNKLFEYHPGPGQFINKAPGNFASAGSILGKTGMVTLGAWGGYIVLGFNHAVLNRAETADLIIYNNAFATFAEPGIVWVMKDENGNGKPDDTWYEIAGSEFNKTGYQRNYSVTYTRPTPDTDPIPWKDSNGNTGVVATNTFHKQSYFPAWVTGNTYTLTGSLLPSGNINRTNPNNITSTPFAYGYADNTNGGDRIDIADAVDQNGNKVVLSSIDFVKIQTGIQANMGWLGELSTEVNGVADLSMVP
ncbi:putative cell surface protein [Pedobacter sp. BAL39]|uniref:hypothetical protein n=1 Tax=Pedobacter sp. BAL39 TaxID=391596 RepID=UPI0001559392|nr:hypothetical protein [Pedobacter sp. BAL39]EDM38198.1 putative cell surface protein [Pedobacter sp. BAL39]